MFNPVVDISPKLNELSAQFDSLEREYKVLATLVYRYTAEMQDNVAISIKIAERQLELLKEYLQCPVNQRKLGGLKQKIVECKEGLEKKYVGIFKTVISRQTEIPNEGEFKKMNSEMRDHLFQEMCTKLSEQLARDFGDVNVDENTDFLALQSHFEKKVREKNHIFHQFFQERLEVEKAGEKLYPVLQKVEKEKNELSKSLTQAVGDLFLAAQVRDVDWLKNALSKLSSSKATFVNQKKKDSESQFTALHTAAYFDHADFLRLLLINRGSVNVQDQYRYTPLHFAAKRGAVRATRILLDFGAKVNVRGEYGRTPLIMAAYNGHPTVAQLLVSRGADVNSQNEKKEGAGDGLASLHQAVFNGRLEVVKVLVASPQLDVLKCDVKGFSPLYYAFEMGLSSILDLLLNHRSWADPKDPKNPNRLENLLKITPKENLSEVVKIVTQKQREGLILKEERALWTEKMPGLEIELKKYRQERTRQLKSNGVSRSQRSAMVEQDARKKREELLDKIEKEIQEALKDMIKKEEKRKVTDL